MSSCAVVLLLENLVGAIAGMGIVACCWALRNAISRAKTYDSWRTSKGLFSTFAIYVYLRRYSLIVLIAGFVILFVSLVMLISQLHSSCADLDPANLDPVGPVCGLLLALAALHLPTIGWFVKDRQGDDYRSLRQNIRKLVSTVGKYLWGLAATLLCPAALLIILRALASAMG